MQTLHSSVRVQVWGKVPLMSEEGGKNVRPRGKNTGRGCWGTKPTSLETGQTSSEDKAFCSRFKIRKHRRGLAGCPLAGLLFELGQETRIPANPKANGRDNIAQHCLGQASYSWL